MRRKTFIFDFDGVIADSFEETLKALNEQADKYNYNKVDLSDISRLRRLSHTELYIHSFGISPLKMFLGLGTLRRILRGKIKKFKPIDGIVPILNQLKENGHQLGIVTSNSPENVQIFLKNNKLDLFDFVSSGRIFSKHRTIRKCLKQYTFKREDVFYIGDEARDIVAARKNSLKIISVAWGFSAKEILHKHQPDYLIERPEQLLKIADEEI